MIRRADRDNAGIVAECQALEKPRLQEDDLASLKFWKDQEAAKPEVRVRLKLLRVATKRAVLKRDWLRDDSALQNLLILKRPTGTNFHVRVLEADRLKVLWSKIGQDWSHDEVVAALRLYARAVQRSLLKVIESTDFRPPKAAARRSCGIVSV